SGAETGAPGCLGWPAWSGGSWGRTAWAAGRVRGSGSRPARRWGRARTTGRARRGRGARRARPEAGPAAWSAWGWKRRGWPGREGRTSGRWRGRGRRLRRRRRCGRTYLLSPARTPDPQQGQAGGDEADSECDEVGHVATGQWQRGAAGAVRLGLRGGGG